MYTRFCERDELPTRRFMLWANFTIASGSISLLCPFTMAEGGYPAVKRSRLAVDSASEYGDEGDEGDDDGVCVCARYV